MDTNKQQVSVNNIVDAIKEEQLFLYEKYLNLEITSDDKNINEFSRNENAIKVIFDQINLKLLYVSESVVSIFGFTPEELNFFHLPFLLKFISFEHLLYPYTVARWSKEVFNKINTLENLKTTTCGLKVKHKKGHEIRLLIRYSPLELLDNGATKLAAVSIDNITHLLKNDFYWVRQEAGKNKEFVHHFLSTDKKDQAQDIISPREMEVLRLIAEGKESKAIAESLFISLFTVDNHRRNMIARTGVRDMTALIQICQMAGII
jgi:DNA-binding CsgD family transcriptional regulator